MDEGNALCKVNVKFMLNEIMIWGNFGHYDTRCSFASKDKKFKRGLTMLKLKMKYMMLYPAEVLCSSVWKMWRYCWRIQKGYL